VKLFQAALAGAAVGVVMMWGHQIVVGQATSTPAASARQSSNAQTIERGRYIVEIGGCNDCHTAGYAEAGGKADEKDRLKGDMLGYRGPWGTTYPTNLRLTFSKMTEDQWLKYAKGLMTRPPMPWFNVRAMTDADLRAVYQYVKQMPGPVGTAAPAFLAPEKAPKQPYIQWPGVK
jgi:mono/diheme cytochrome c family protein